MNIMIVNLEPTTLAFASDREESLAVAKLDAFLTGTGIVPAHRYQNELSLKKDGKRVSLFIKYASVPAGTKKAKDVNVADLPGGPALSFRLPESAYIPLMDGEFRQELEEFLKANGLWWDLRQMMALAEARTENGAVVYDILFPVKRK